MERKNRKIASVGLSVLSLALLVLAPIAGLAQDPKESVDEVITVTANRDEVPVSEVGSSVTVIDTEEIEARAQVNVSDLLRTVPGVEVVQTGGAGKNTSVRLRGGSAEQVLVLIDGVRVNTATASSVDFAHLLASNVERVEIVRGPQATYGSEAMSGVINILTRRGEGELSGSLGAEAGSRAHEVFEGSLRGGLERFDYSLGFTDLSTDTVSQISGGTEPDPYENTTLTGRLGAAIGDDGRLDLSVRSYEGDVALDGFGVEDLNAGAVSDGQSVALSLAKDFTPRWRQTLRATSASTDLLGEDPDTFFNNYDIQSETSLYEAQADVILSDQHTLNVGISREEREGFNLGSFDVDAELDSWFVQDQWSPSDRVHFTAAVRSDDHATFGDETTYRVTGSVGLGDGGSRLRGSFGTAFRAPNFNELYFPFAGDPNLLPETSEGWDLALHHRFGDSGFTLDLGYFDLSFEDLIQFDLSTFTFGNVAEATSSGVELALGYAQQGFDLTLSHTYNDTEDVRTERPLARRPEHRTTLGAVWTAQKLTTSVQAMSVRDRIDSSGLEMDDYTRVDLSLQYEVLPWLHPFVRAENALDEDYEEVPGFETPGGTYIVGVGIKR